MSTVNEASGRSLPSYKAGVLTLSVICGLIDCTCLLALGGVFAELMTGNLLLLSVTFGAGVLRPERLGAYAGAIIPFLLGALTAGIASNGRHKEMARIVGYPIEWFFVVLAAVLALFLTSSVSGSLAEQTFLVNDLAAQEPTPYATRMLLVALLAFAMGIHNALMRKHGVPDVATNVLTLTLTGLVSESKLARGASPNWGRRSGSILLFMVGAAIGAWLLRFSIAAPLLAASVLFTAALWPLMKGRTA